MHWRVGWPPDLPRSAAATHIGMYVTWALLTGLGDEAFVSLMRDRIDDLDVRRITPGRFLFEDCDGKFVDTMLSDHGNAFTRWYYSGDMRQYLDDYFVSIPGRYPSLPHYPDTWASFDALRPAIDRRFDEWRARGG